MSRDVPRGPSPRSNSPSAGSSIRAQASLVRTLFGDNGAAWTFYFLLRRPLRRLLVHAERRLTELEISLSKPGLNSRSRNRVLWGDFDWVGDGGEEWSVSPEFKRSVVDCILLPHTPKGGSVLEIGPGGGRWSEFIQKEAGRLVLVDLSPEAIESCKKRLRGYKDVDFHVVDGASLSVVSSNTIDMVWSFDTFVHICPADIRSYLMEVARVLKRHGVAVIHHTTSETNAYGRWRSGMSDQHLLSLCEAAGLVRDRRIDSWGPMCQFSLGGTSAVSVLRKQHPSLR